MSIRALLTSMFVVALILGTGLIVLSSAVLQSQLVQLVPPDVVAQIEAGLQTLLVEQVIVMFLFAALLLGVLFYVLGELVARPLQLIVDSMKTYATTGTRTQLPSFPKTPSEMRALSEVFVAFADRVELSHRHDVEASRVKSDFISTAAHQLRTPLTAIRWALEALDKESLSEEQHALVKNARDKSHDLVEIVKTLLDISSIESGKYHYTFVRTDMGALASSVTNDFLPLATEKNVALSYTPSESPLPSVAADQERIKWILNNLIENAIRYTPAGGGVHVSTDSATDRVFVRVRDDGIGIAEEDRANIFERFYRAPNAISKENQGNGLGLYIARTIATDHGGDLNFSSNEGGVGTTFILSLPVQLAAAQPA